MALRDENEDLLKQLIHFKDHREPSIWQQTIDTCLSQTYGAKKNYPEQIAADNMDIELFQTMFNDWKYLFREGYLDSGRAYDISLWLALNEPEKQRELFKAAMGGRTETNYQGGMGGLTFGFIAHLPSDQFCLCCVRTILGEIFKELIDLDLTEAESLNDSGFALHSHGNYENAINFHDDALQSAPDFHLAWINKGIALKNLERFDEAITCYDHVIDNIDPEYKKAWHNKGVALIQKGLLNEALACLDRAIEIDPEYDVALRVREQCIQQLDSKNNEQFTEQELDEAIKDHPDVFPLLQMFDSAKLAGNLDIAESLIRQAIELLPGDHPVLIMNLGSVLFESGKKEEALETIQKALSIRPNYGNALIELSRYYLDLKDFEKALNAADRATQTMPEHSMGWANKAAALCGLERFKEAMKAAETACNIDDRNPFALYYLGVCQGFLGQKIQAIQTLERILKTQANSEMATPARRLISYLKEKS